MAPACTEMERAVPPRVPLWNLPAITELESAVSVWLPAVVFPNVVVAGGGPDDVPVPVNVTTCGLPPALSVIVIAPLLVPVVVGVNVTLIVQLALIASELGHVVAA